MAVAERLRGPMGNTANTKALLVEPLLASLGWDTFNVEHVVRDWPLRDESTISYALRIHDANTVFVETRSVADSLDDYSFESQTLQRVENEDARWCVITNGLSYKVYKSNEPVKDDRMLFGVDLAAIAQGESGSEERLELIGREALIDGSLELRGEEFFTDPRVREAILILARDPSRAFINAMNEAIGSPSVPVERLRASLARAFSRHPEVFDGPLAMHASPLAGLGRRAEPDGAGPPGHAGAPDAALEPDGSEESEPAGRPEPAEEPTPEPAEEPKPAQEPEVAEETLGPQMAAHEESEADAQALEELAARGVELEARELDAADEAPAEIAEGETGTAALEAVEGEAGAEPHAAVEFEADAGPLEAQSELEAGSELDAPTEAEVVEASELEADGERGAETELEAETEVEAGLEAEAEVESGLEAEAEVESGLEAETELQSELETELEADTEVESGLDTETELEADTEAESALDTESESRAGAATELGQEAESALESESESGAATELGQGTEAAPEADSEPAAEAGSEAATEPEQETESEAEPESGAATELELEAELEAQPEPGAATELGQEIESESESELEAEADEEEAWLAEPEAAAGADFAGGVEEEWAEAAEPGSGPDAPGGEPASSVQEAEPGLTSDAPVADEDEVSRAARAWAPLMDLDGPGEFGEEPIVRTSARRRWSDSYAGVFSVGRGEHSLKEHLEGKPDAIVELFMQLDEYSQSLGTDTSRRVRRQHIQYLHGKKPWFTLELHEDLLRLDLALDPAAVRAWWSPDEERGDIAIRDRGPGETEYTLTGSSQLEEARQLIWMAYEGFSAPA